MGNYFSKGSRTTYKTLKATCDPSEAQKHTYVRCFETKVSFEIKLTLLASMFLFFFELASATISRS